MVFLNALFNYALVFICMIGVVVSAVLCGKKLRDRKDSKNKGNE